MEKILKPGGVLALTAIPNFASAGRLFHIESFKGNMPPGHLNFFSFKTIRALLSSLHFTIVRKDSWGINIPSGLRKNGMQKLSIYRIMKKLLYNPINMILNSFNRGSVIDIYAIKSIAQEISLT